MGKSPLAMGEDPQKIPIYNNERSVKIHQGKSKCKKSLQQQRAQMFLRGLSQNSLVLFVSLWKMRARSQTILTGSSH